MNQRCLIFSHVPILCSSCCFVTVVECADSVVLLVRGFIMSAWLLCRGGDISVFGIVLWRQIKSSLLPEFAAAGNEGIGCRLNKPDLISYYATVSSPAQTDRPMTETFYLVAFFFPSSSTRRAHKLLCESRARRPIWAVKIPLNDICNAFIIQRHQSTNTTQ